MVQVAVIMYVRTLLMGLCTGTDRLTFIRVMDTFQTILSMHIWYAKLCAGGRRVAHWNSQLLVPRHKLLRPDAPVLGDLVSASITIAQSEVLRCDDRRSINVSDPWTIHCASY